MITSINPGAHIIFACRRCDAAKLRSAPNLVFHLRGSKCPQPRADRGYVFVLLNQTPGALGSFFPRSQGDRRAIHAFHYTVNVADKNAQVCNVDSNRAWKSIQSRPSLSEFFAATNKFERAQLYRLSSFRGRRLQSLHASLGVLLKQKNAMAEPKIQASSLSQCGRLVNSFVESDFRHRCLEGQCCTSIHERSAAKRDDCSDERLPISKRKAFGVNTDRDNQDSRENEQTKSQQSVLLVHAVLLNDLGQTSHGSRQPIGVNRLNRVRRIEVFQSTQPDAPLRTEFP